MKRTVLTSRVARLALVCGAVGLLVGSCDKGQSASTAPPLDALPLTDAVTPSTPAPAASRLPTAPPAPLARLQRPQDSYAYLDRAYAAAQAYAGAPPDYSVDYDGERPWIWRASDNSERVVERTPQGLRYVYYEPGANEPYLVQDGGFTYAYSDGRLVAIYGPDGELEPYAYVERRTDMAGRYLAWAAALYAASRQQQRLAVERAHWDERRADIDAERAAWSAEQSRDAAWAAYHQPHAAEEQAHWDAEAQRRQAEVVRYAAVAPQPQRAPPPAPGGDPFVGSPPRGGFAREPQPFGARRFTTPAPGLPNAPPERFAQGASPAQNPSGPQFAPGVAEAQRQAILDQGRAQAQAQRQAADQAHATALAAERQAQGARLAAEQQREQALQQTRAAAQADRQAAEQAHAAQQQAAHAALAEQQTGMQQRRAAQAAEQAQASQQEAARAAAQAAREGALQQSRAAGQAQRQAADQAHAAQQAAQAAQRRVETPAARPAHQAPPNGPHDHPRAPGEAAHPGQQP